MIIFRKSAFLLAEKQKFFKSEKKVLHCEKNCDRMTVSSE